MSARMSARFNLPQAARRLASRPRDALWAVRQGYCALVVLAAGLQAIFFWADEDNLEAVAIALVSSLIGIVYSLRAERFRSQPISALMLLFYTTTATSGALLVKCLEWSALVDRLTVPLETFAVLFAVQLTLIAVDQLYLWAEPLRALRSWLTRRVAMPLGLFRWPSGFELWLLGFIGLASVALTGTDYESGVSFGMAGAGAKLIRAFGFLKYAPFLIPFRDALSGFPARTRLTLLPLGAYFVALVVISFATNSRSTFADAIPTIGVSMLLATGLGRIDWKRVPPGQLLAFALAAGLGSLLLSRVALAMVVVRDYRSTVDVGMLINMTFEALFNSEWLAAAKSKMDSAITVGDYSETYVDSRFFARFLLTKFHDNIVYYFSLMGPDQISSYQQFMIDRLWGTLPEPLLRLLGVDIDKQDLVISNGDFVIYLVDGWGLGGFKTGSMMGEVFGVFRWAFPLVLAAAALAVFVVYDAFVTSTPAGRLAVAPLVLLLIWNLVGTTASIGLGTESVTQIPSSIVRGLPQNIVMYLVAATVVRGVASLLARRPRPPRRLRPFRRR